MNDLENGQLALSGESKGLGSSDSVSEWTLQEECALRGTDLYPKICLFPLSIRLFSSVGKRSGEESGRVRVRGWEGEWGVREKDWGPEGRERRREKCMEGKSAFQRTLLTRRIPYPVPRGQWEGAATSRNHFGLWSWPLQSPPSLPSALHA